MKKRLPNEQEKQLMNKAIGTHRKIIEIASYYKKYYQFKIDNIDQEMKLIVENTKKALQKAKDEDCQYLVDLNQMFLDEGIRAKTHELVKEYEYKMKPYIEMLEQSTQAIEITSKQLKNGFDVSEKEDTSESENVKELNKENK